MENAVEARSWRDVLAQTREYNQVSARHGRGRFDLRKYWRAQAYAAHAGEPEPVVRAQAFRTVLERVPLRIYPGERIAGSRAGFVAAALPEGISPADYDAAVCRHDQRGQRDFRAGFDHAAPDYPTLLAVGIDGVAARVRASMARHEAPEQRQILEAFLMALAGLSALAGRYAAGHRAAGDGSLAEVLEWIGRRPPRTFHEAVQLVWLVHIAFVSEGRYAMALGRLDQYLLPFYQRDLAAGRMTPAGALELLCHLWAKVEELGEVTNITIGGLTPAGADATNDLSRLCLEATRAVLSPHTNLSARLHDGSPEWFHEACFHCIRTGVGFPALFNDHVLIPGLVDIGIPAEVARDYCLVGCIETHFPGRQQPWGDGSGVPGSTHQCLLNAMRRLQREAERSYPRLLALFREEVREFFETCAGAVNAHIARFPVERFPDPFLSVLTRDCIGRARDINAGGAAFTRFFAPGCGGSGLGTLADAVAAVKKLVFDDAAVGYDALMAALDADFEGHEPLRQMLLHRAPKYGNDDDEVDGIAADLLDTIAGTAMSSPTRIHGGGRFLICAAGNIHNIRTGRALGATPDGRHAGEPVSDSTSPHFGRDVKGPTAVLRSMGKTACRRVLGGRVANLKFEPTLFADQAGVRRFSAITHDFVRRRIQEMQVNFTGNAVLQDAYDHPERHANLVVRVSGFSAYFTQLQPEVQRDVIRRRAHA